jgi:CDP-glycerol glycerophosphotransferase (TagB/SpsB family)/glycosyltransferase involved in cell wall biosynthesis
VTRFSIVLPVYNVRAYLRDCVDSILSQSFGDFELIAVDDHSPDHSGEILDEYAAIDPRVEVIHLKKNVGLGLAREAGIAAATGEYLLFVDSDDLMAAGSLAAISARIDATDAPDIVVFDYSRQYWNRVLQRNTLAELLAAPGPKVFTIDERPELLTLLMVVWNKAYRREFITAGGFHFPKGYYEDTPWTYPTLLSAKRIAILDRVCVYYRMRREAGNILKSRSRKHFEIYDQWDLVFGWLDEHPELAHWRGFLLRRELEHVATILDNERRLPKDARREFFRLGHANYERYKPAEPVPVPDGIEGLRVRLIMRNAYLPYRAVAATTKLAEQAMVGLRLGRRKAGQLYRRGQRMSKRMYYRIQVRLPLDPKLAVYSAYWDRGVLCSPAAIYYKARELAPDVHGVFLAKQPETAVLPSGVDWVRADSFAAFRALARAKYLINNANFPDFVRKRKGAVHVQTQHGTPLKKMGLDLQDFPVGANRMSFARLLKRVDRWDYNVSSNRFSTEVWERSYPAGFETLEVGYPRNDRLVTATAAEAAAIRKELKLPEGARVVLFAPTFRDYRKVFDPEVDLGALVDAIGDDSVLLIRAHYFLGDETTRLSRLASSGRVRDVSQYPSIEDLCIASDVLLTDYSSIMFDYAILDRPIAIYAYDWDTYVRTRGVNFDLVAEPPGAVATTAAELLDAFREGEVWGEQAAKARVEFRRRFCTYDDGHAAEHVVRRVFLGERLPARLESQSTAVTERAEPVDDERETNAAAADVPAHDVDDETMAL